MHVPLLSRTTPLPHPLPEAEVPLKRAAPRRHAGDVLANLERHTGGVRALEFNPGMPNLLASGAGGSEVLITDLAKPESPNFYSPGATPSGEPADSACTRENAANES